MTKESEIPYEGVLYHLPLYEDETVKNVILANKQVEHHKDKDGYIILTNYRFIFMEKVEELHYRLTNFFYYKDILKLVIGGVVNKFILINGVLFHPKDTTVEFIKSSVQKLTEEAKKQSFSFKPQPAEPPIPEVKINDRVLFNKILNFLFPLFSITMGILMIIISAFWIYTGPHARITFNISILGTIFSSILTGLVKYEKNAEYYSEELYESLKNTLLLSIFSLIISSIGLGFEGYYNSDINVFCGRNNFLLVFTFTYFAFGVILVFKIMTNYSNFPYEPENPLGELNKKELAFLDQDNFQNLSNLLLIVFIIIVSALVITFLSFNVLNGADYFVFSWRYSYIPSPLDLVFVLPKNNYEIFATTFTALVITTGVFAIILSGLLQIRNFSYLRYYGLDLVKAIRTRIEEEVQNRKILMEKIKNKTQDILSRMHSTVTSVISKIAGLPPQPTIQDEKEIEIITPFANIEPNIKIAQTQTTPSKESISTSQENTMTPEIEKQTIDDTIIGKIEAKRGGNIKGREYLYKVKIENLSNSVITDLRIIITSYPVDSLIITGPEIQKRNKLAPNEMISPSFTFRPTEDCVVGNINSIVTYLNAKGEPKQITVEPYQIRFICGLLTPLAIKAEEFDQIIKRLLNYANAGEDIELPHNAKTIYEKAKIILPHNNFHLINAEEHPVASNFIGILKGFAAGQYSHKKVGIKITINGGKEENFCVARIDGYTEDTAMLSPLINEITNEIKCWNCEQCGAQLADSQIKQILSGTIVRCKYCEEILMITK